MNMFRVLHSKIKNNIRHKGLNGILSTIDNTKDYGGN